MTNNFSTTWAKEHNIPLSKKIANTLNPKPLSERVTQTIYRLNIVRRKLEDSRNRTEQKHKALFGKCVSAQEMKNSQVAVMYANECSQVRRIAQAIISSQLALEQVVLRLETVKDFGDVAAEIMPASAVIRTVQGRLAGVIPEVSMHLATIGQTLDNLVLEAGQTTGLTFNTMISGDESDKILAEATVIAEQKVREGFPELPRTSAVEERINPP